MTPAEKRSAERAARRAQIDREVSGEARGFRYAIECHTGWVGPHERPGPHVHDDTCTRLEPVIFDGDLASAQARAGRHADRNGCGGAIHHSPMIVPESEIKRRIHARGFAHLSRRSS